MPALHEKWAVQLSNDLWKCLVWNGQGWTEPDTTYRSKEEALKNG